MVLSQYCVIILTALILLPLTASQVVCPGTRNGLSNVLQNIQDVETYLKKQFHNSEGQPCTYIEGNLELTHIKNSSIDLSFLESITEVSGSVIIYQVAVQTIPLRKLAVIRGKNSYQNNYSDNTKKGCALYVDSNLNERRNGGLRYLDLSSLKDIIIQDTSICIIGNHFLCNMDTVDWGDILMGSVEKRLFLLGNNGYNCTNSCSESCSSGKCWGPEESMCQDLTYSACHNLCKSRQTRCAAPNNRDMCCDEQCAGGCSGVYQTDCLACRRFHLDGKCLDECPDGRSYDPNTQEMITTGDVYYTMGNRCVKQCDAKYVVYRTYCMKSCPLGFETTGAGRICDKCKGACERVCTNKDIYGVNEGLLYISSRNIHKLEGCTDIKGQIMFNRETFIGKDALSSIKQLEYLKEIKRVSNFINFELSNTQSSELVSKINSLEFLSNLEIIQGLDTISNALLIHNLPKLKYLGLKSLKVVQDKDIVLSQLPELCYHSQKMLEGIAKSGGVRILRVGERCQDKHCDEECSEGCWGPGPNMCINCKNYIFGEKCVGECDTENKLFVERGNLCQPCHAQCKSTCNGPLATDCTNGCSKFNLVEGDNVKCVENCLEGMYKDGLQCKGCHAYCTAKYNCTGVNGDVGEGGCRHCENIMEYKLHSTIHNDCMDPNLRGEQLRKSCVNSRADSFIAYDRKQATGAYSMVCRECHPECDGCIDGDTYKDCIKCKKYTILEPTNLTGKMIRSCYSECPVGYYRIDHNMSCAHCHDQCHGGCGGPSQYDCNGCINVKKLEEDGRHYCAQKCNDSEYMKEDRTCSMKCDNNTYADKILKKCSPCHYECKNGCHGIGSFNCSECKHVSYQGNCLHTCPENSEVGVNTHICEPLPPLSSGAIIGIVLALICIIILIIIVVCFWHRITVKKQKGKIKRKYSTIDATMLAPLKPSGVAPSNAQLRLIKESSLKQLGELGSGAFGTVYEGIWTPQNDNDNEKQNKKDASFHVAIKVLKNVGSVSANKEFLDEAYVMATCHHVCLVELLAVSMPAQQMMLITQLMPLGSLLEYLKTKKSKIGPQHLLTWCRQIATGMAYLEEKRLVHRDLAARNVLVQKPTQVKITDFGLAKVLDIGEDSFTHKGGQFPIRWLALETLQHCIFTHQSDVWAFGVTIWEVLTFGGKPYEGIGIREVTSHLVKGERLPQPPTCTIDIYLLLIKCWMAEPKCRPNFIELEVDLSKMAKDPMRYIRINNGDICKDDEYPTKNTDACEANGDQGINNDNPYVSTPTNYRSCPFPDPLEAPRSRVGGYMSDDDYLEPLATADHYYEGGDTNDQYLNPVVDPNDQYLAPVDPRLTPGPSYSNVPNVDYSLV